MKVSDLAPGLRKVDIIVKVVTKSPIRQVFVRKNNTNHDVADLLVGDETGTVSMTLWDEMSHQIQENDVIQIANGYVSEYAGKVQLNIGQYGQWRRLDTEEYEIEVDLESSTGTISSGERSGQLMKVINVLQKQFGINLLVKVLDQKETRHVTTKKDGVDHMVLTYVVGDETGCIDFVLWDKGDDIAVGDVLEIRGGYTREFNKSLQLNLARTGSYTRSSFEMSEEMVNTRQNLSES